MISHKLFTKNFILLILGQLTSLFGNFILKLALSMYILDITGSATIFARVLAIATIPTILLSPIGGILADRANKRNIMVALDILTGVSVLLSAIFMSEKNAVTNISTLLIALSILGAFETPTVQACIPSMLSDNNITRANAIVNQVSSISCLVAPMLGSILYTMLGLRPVMYASIFCFFITALFECFIKLNCQTVKINKDIISSLVGDLFSSISFLVKGNPFILKILILSSIASFFLTGIAVVGLPYIVRTILSLKAEYYGAAESLLAVSAVLGSITAGLIIGKFKIHNLYITLSSIGVFIIPAGIAFMCPISATAKYAATVASFCLIQASVNIFSIFAVSIIQQRTPNHLIGKIMAHTSAITLSIQPIGQIIYGFLFDIFKSSIFLVLIPSGIIICIIGLLSKKMFYDFEKNSSMNLN
ncbi:hypothetical protein IMSAG049_00500 [Clostridiales bacterium]|nr:hypothetical protein IMSAG049_00500 [Clostridiales bacterium]